MLTVLTKIGIGFGIAIASMVLVFLGFAMFCATPTGDYHVDTGIIGCEHENRALVARVYQDMLFYPDRVVYEGPPVNAWQIYFNLTTSPMGLRTADLQPW